jgi:hypothetical protein
MNDQGLKKWRGHVRRAVTTRSAVRDDAFASSRRVEQQGSYSRSPKSGRGAGTARTFAAGDGEVRRVAVELRVL